MSCHLEESIVIYDNIYVTTLNTQAPCLPHIYTSSLFSVTHLQHSLPHCLMSCVFHSLCIQIYIHKICIIICKFCSTPPAFSNFSQQSERYSSIVTQLLVQFNHSHVKLSQLHLKLQMINACNARFAFFSEANISLYHKASYLIMQLYITGSMR